jgi:hypothetical protein
MDDNRLFCAYLGASSRDRVERDKAYNFFTIIAEEMKTDFLEVGVSSHMHDHVEYGQLTPHIFDGHQSDQEAINLAHDVLLSVFTERQASPKKIKYILDEMQRTGIIFRKRRDA